VYPLRYLTGALVALGICSSASAAFVINEIDSDTINQTGPSVTDPIEFVELKGQPNESAAGLVLVYFNGGTTTGGSPVGSYRAIDLSAATADANGYLMVGTTTTTGGVEISHGNNILQNGEDAVALYQAAAISFPNNTQPTTANLIDYVVYEATASNNINWSGFGGTPTVYRENFNGAADSYSISRVPNETGKFFSTPPTPRATNHSAPAYTAGISQIMPPRLNQATAVVPTTRTITLTNSGIGVTTVNQITLSAAASAEYSLFDAPTFPVVLDERNEVTTIGVQLVDPSPLANKSYTAAIEYSTDNSTTPNGSIDISSALVRATTTANVGDVKVNEVVYNPGTVDHNADGSTANQGDEFVELVNMTASPINIEGWEQRCTDGDDASTFHSFVFPAGATIPANGFVTVFSGGTPTGFTPAGTTFVYGAARIRNTGAYVGINDGTKLINGVGYLDAGADSPDADGYDNAGVTTSGGGSFGRRPDGSSTFRAFSPTDVVLTDRPSPNTTNGTSTSNVGEWMIYQ